MKKVCIVGMERFSLHDGPGIRTTIFFKGCNLRCIWCHNPETYEFSIQEYDKENKKQQYGKYVSIEEIKKYLLKDKEYYTNSQGGVTLSGGEALLQIKACVEIVDFCINEGINVCIETSGAVPSNNIDYLLQKGIMWLFDYKLSEIDKYDEYIKGDYYQIMKNLEYLLLKKEEVILRCPMVHTINDTQLHFEKLKELSKRVKSVEILPYHNLGKGKADNLGISNYLYLENTTEDVIKKWKGNLLGYNNFIIK